MSLKSRLLGHQAAPRSPLLATLVVADQAVVATEQQLTKAEGLNSWTLLLTGENTLGNLTDFGMRVEWRGCRSISVQQLNQILSFLYQATIHKCFFDSEHGSHKPSLYSIYG
jgi:hypothetical protein